jgi:hypothetical protein
MDSGNAGRNFSASVNLAGVEPASPSRHHTNQPNWTVRAINHREGWGALEYWPSLQCVIWVFIGECNCYFVIFLQCYGIYSGLAHGWAAPSNQPIHGITVSTILLLLAQLDKTPIRVGPLVFEFCVVNQAPTYKINSILQSTLDQ